MQQPSIPFSFFKVKKEPDETYSVFNRLTCKTYELNASAAYIIWMCDGTKNTDAITEKLREQFSLDSGEARKAVAEFLAFLQEKRVLVWRTSKVEKVEAPAPKFIIFEVTNRCNLNCIHCSVCANERKCLELSTQEWTTVMRDLADMGTRDVGLSGGEPLLRRDIFELAAYAKDAGLQVGLVTNGLLLNEENITSIKRLDISVQVSLDGANAASHDHIRNSPHSFQRVTRKLELLRKHGVDFTIATVATAQNYADLPELLKLAEKLGAVNFRVQPFFPVGRGSVNGNELNLDAAMTREVTAFLMRASKQTRMQVGGFYFQFLLESEPAATSEPCKDASCSGGYDFAGITPDGFVYPCSHIWQLGDDNVREEPFAWIWQNSRMLNFFRSLRREDVNDTCQLCKFFSKCLGGCRAMNLLQGNIFAPDSHCWLAHPPRNTQLISCS